MAYSILKKQIAFLFINLANSSCYDFFSAIYFLMPISISALRWHYHVVKVTSLWCPLIQYSSWGEGISIEFRFAAAITLYVI